MEQLAEVEQMENNSKVDEQSQKIQMLEMQLQQMETNHKNGEQAIDILNGLHSEGQLSFQEDGKVNVIGNAHEQQEEEEKEWVRLTQFEWYDELSG